jgi:thiamine-monophosphate kinase
MTVARNGHATSGTTIEDHITIAELGEFGLIAAMADKMPRGPLTIIGIGDDAAVLRAPDARVVAATDLLVEGRHFRRDWSGPGDIGCKAAARNLADVAAMGAKPTALLAGLSLPGQFPVRWALDLAAGLADEAARGGASVAGGDLASGDVVVLAVTALGDLEGRPPVTRSGARPGDIVAVAGRLGHAAAGLALLQAGLAGPAGLVAAHLRPAPPYEAGPEAAVLGATSMIDISDGLLQDLGHVAAASGVRIDIETARLEAGGPLAAAAAALGTPRARHPAEQARQKDLSDLTGQAADSAPLTWVLSGGEDHALAATFPPEVTLPAHWSVIGRVSAGDGVRVDGERYPGPPGWDHFR